MSKLINLNDELTIPAGSILKITGPFYTGLEWYCVIAYKVFGDVEYYSEHFNKTFVREEQRAKEEVRKLVERINELI
jgi:uncharacterized C2H2 Zn-finger protein